MSAPQSDKKVGMFQRLDEKMKRHAVGRYFKLEGSGVPGERKKAVFSTELRAGLATFVTMAYIGATTSSIMGFTGGNCSCPSRSFACTSDAKYNACVAEFKQNYVTSVSLVAFLSCYLMGIFANLPFGLAPGLSLSAYFAFQVVGAFGSGKIPYKTAEAAIFIEGIILFFFSLSGLRQVLAKAIPNSIKEASAAGIGLFLTHIGLQSAAGIGFIAYSPATLVTIGGCTDSNKLPDGQCSPDTTMAGGKLWLGLLGFTIIVVMNSLKIKGSALIGILFVSFVSWIPNTNVTLWSNTVAGQASFEYFKKVADSPRLAETAFLLDLRDMFSRSDVWGVMFSFLALDTLERTATLFSMAKLANLMNRDGDYEGSYQSYIVDSICVAMSGLFGVTPTTTLIETGAGISEGGKTGITAIVTGTLFFFSLFFAPIFSNFPAWATGPILIVVGVFMAQSSLNNINWKYFPDAVPAFLTMAVMPLTYSISDGICTGLAAYVAINSVLAVIEHATNGKWVPEGKEHKEKVVDSLIELTPLWWNLRVLKANTKTLLTKMKMKPVMEDTESGSLKGDIVHTVEMGK